MPDESALLLAGTLDLLILKTLSLGVLHGYGVAQNIRRLSAESFRIEEGSLYPALSRMEVKGWVKSVAKKTPTGRMARYYRLTRSGRRQLGLEEKAFLRSSAATRRVLRAAES